MPIIMRMGKGESPSSWRRCAGISGEHMASMPRRFYAPHLRAWWHREAARARVGEGGGVMCAPL
jgi:hypothetical protein